MTSKRFKILTIDGGGMKGVYSVSILARFEEIFEIKIADKFDLICGTSTGGIIAAGIALGKPANDILKLYLEEGPKIFRGSKNRLKKIKNLLFSSKYNHKQIKDTLDKFFGEKKFGDVKTKLCIPTFNLSTGLPYVFKTDHAKGLTRDGNRLLSEAVLASTSAPIYFPAFKSKTNYFVDGGVWANNPSLIGLIEALRFFVGKNQRFDEISILSVSSINEHFKRIKQPLWRHSLLGWNVDLIELLFFAQLKSTEKFMTFITDNLGTKTDYFRIDSPPLSKGTIKKIDLDNTQKGVIEHMQSEGNSKAEHLKNENFIENIFA